MPCPVSNIPTKQRQSWTEKRSLWLVQGAGGRGKGLNQLDQTGFGGLRVLLYTVQARRSARKARARPELFGSFGSPSVALGPGPLARYLSLRISRSLPGTALTASNASRRASFALLPPPPLPDTHGFPGHVVPPPHHGYPPPPRQTKTGACLPPPLPQLLVGTQTFHVTGDAAL